MDHLLSKEKAYKKSRPEKTVFLFSFERFLSVVL